MSKFGRTELHLACRSNDTAAVQRLCNISGVSLNVKDDHGFTPLYHTAIFGNIESMRILLSAGADTHIADLGGLTPLHIAAEKCQPQAVKLLLEHGANPTAKDSIGRTARDWAESKHIAIVLQAFDACGCCS